MSEEEIRTRIYNLIQISRLGALRDENFKEEYEKDRQALEGLLDLYQKEKEKNKILDNMLLVNKEQYEFIKNKDNYISKDKIKAMVDKINKDYDDSVDEEGNHTCYYPDYTIDKLQELLEERN